MRFHFLLTNHFRYGCFRIEDICMPIAMGLGELGHTVTYGFDDDVPPWPAVNLLVENFNNPAVVDQMERLKSGPQRFCFGLVGHEDLADSGVFRHPSFPDRLRNLERALQLVDFGWTIVPCDYSGLPGGQRMRFLEYGYSPGLRHESGLPRDIDVLFYGELGDRRLPLFNALVGQGLRVEASFGLLPAFFVQDLIDRAKIVADIGRAEGLRFLTPTRICAALQRGATVLSERIDRSPLAKLYRYTAPVTLGDFVETAVAVARSGRAPEIGQKARDLFAAETSMSVNLRRVMDLRVFTELAQA
jgi:hypothetical protein